MLDLVNQIQGGALESNVVAHRRDKEELAPPQSLQGYLQLGGSLADTLQAVHLTEIHMGHGHSQASELPNSENVAAPTYESKPIGGLRKSLDRQSDRLLVQEELRSLLKGQLDSTQLILPHASRLQGVLLG